MGYNYELSIPLGNVTNREGALFYIHILKTYLSSEVLYTSQFVNRELIPSARASTATRKSERNYDMEKKLWYRGLRDAPS
jgi:hypothetical protein